MRLIIIIKICLACILFFASFETNAQKHDSAYWASWAKLSKIIDSSFRSKQDTSIFEQTAIVQFNLKFGIVDTFYIWSTYEKYESKILNPCLAPVIGKYFEGYKKFKYVLVPIRLVDNRRNDGKKFSDDFDFIVNFIDSYKHSFNTTFTIAQGLLLDAPWIKPKSER